MEDIVEKHMNEILKKKQAICTCEKCRDRIAAYVLSRIPACYVTTESGAMYSLMEKTKVEELSIVLKELLDAIKAVGRGSHD
jgi:competence protein ComFB